MKKEIHPTYHTNVKVTCACGNTFVTGSTLETMQLEICSNCHPFYTGKSKLVDTAGRVDKFKERLKKAQDRPVKAAKPKGAVVETAEVVTESDEATMVTEPVGAEAAPEVEVVEATEEIPVETVAETTTEPVEVEEPTNEK